MLPIEKENSRVATTKPLDELYTNTYQKTDVDLVQAEGYRFEYPLRWMRDPSVTKAVGFRRIKFLRQTQNFGFVVKFNVTISGSTNSYTRMISLDTSGSLEKTLIDFESNLNNLYRQMVSIKKDLNEGTYYAQVTYDRKTGHVDFIRVENNTSAGSLTTQFETYSWALFLIMLNQNVTSIPDRFNFQNYDLEQKFDNVFDPENTIVHATFSGAKNSFLAMANDFYEKPTKFYEPPSGSISDFQIWFTTNGTKRVVPLYYNFYLELSFIYNYYKSLTTKD
ncbi:hypothetical protein TVAG_192790 [Trichomonas vaginalis G3]|uniref:DUF7777 domain-containing protein n=1 Tax=Trichomonas vaginalis (strain ATCC PRA-98 / G3) TaxID=412133 RepID=A2DGZ3_TRIV3|nr:hypothetical protein TVAGG3_0342050 [Trichomonas vaginalis G3]EAY20303.1 hypothetical protein TVAG_192790 [Trichomonas vaginalis G3]KAI5530712.1 hypothetical protein TVAGG3_0342050 [Trichomonas vaginalis G3]|eukprot:XP_001581289.1 hypothetical protein [Trichomonas vaginalis G3]